MSGETPKEIAERRRMNTELAQRQFGPINRYSLHRELKVYRQRLSALEARVKALESAHLRGTP